jgi:hypothetical protein
MWKTVPNAITGDIIDFPLKITETINVRFLLSLH